MTEEKKSKFNKQSTIIAAIAYLFMLAAIFCIVSARNYVEAEAATIAKTVAFQDNSGKYLKKSGQSWYLRDADNHKLTGLQYLEIGENDCLHRGIYMFDQNGKLVRKNAIYYFKN